MPGPSAAADPKGGGPRRRLNSQASASLTASGRRKGNTHQPNTVNIPTGPEELVYTA